MGDINIRREEQEALSAIDTSALDKTIDQGLLAEQVDALRIFRLDRCGSYVASKLRVWEKAVSEYASAKSIKRRAQAKYHVRDAGSDLLHAVDQMKCRVDAEQKEGQFFFVEDQIMHPHFFIKRLTVQVSYRWRQRIEDEWKYSSITYTHDADLQPDYSMVLNKKKASAAKLAQDRQEKMYREWEYLKRLGLQSVRDYFRTGGDGVAIPLTFQATTSAHGGGLNNYSAQFWTPSSLGRAQGQTMEQ